MKAESKIIAFSVLFGVIYWVIESMMDYLFFFQRSFPDLLILRVPRHEIYIRLLVVGFFTAFGVIISRLLVRKKQAENRVRHLNLLLQAIGDVNRVINREKDRTQLIKTIADSLVEIRGYSKAWIILLDDDHRYIAGAQAGLGVKFLPLIQRLKQGQMVGCMEEALVRPEVFTVEDPPSGCSDCPLSGEYDRGPAMTMRIENSGKIYGLLSVVLPRDFTGYQAERSVVKEIAENVAFSLHSLEQEAKRREAETRLAESETRVRALNEQILRMLAVVSHDIRSPLVSLDAALKLVNRGVYGKIDEGVKGTLEGLHGRILKLLGIAEDYLGKATLVEGGIDLEPKVIDLRVDVINPILEELSSEIQTQNILLDNRLGAISADPIQIMGNRVWLRIIFRNLLGNAIKYGGKGCTIAFGLENRDSFYQLYVYNSGEPVPEHFRDKLFTKFSRLGEETKGVGLGLYMVKEIIEMHGGRVWYEATEDGSNFLFTIPKPRIRDRIEGRKPLEPSRDQGRRAASLEKQFAETSQNSGFKPVESPASVRPVCYPHL